MSEFGTINLVWTVGALLLAGSALAAYHLSWRRSVVYVLMWASIFALVTLVIDAVRP